MATLDRALRSRSHDRLRPHNYLVWYIQAAFSPKVERRSAATITADGTIPCVERWKTACFSDGIVA